MKKKILALWLCLSLIFALAACSRPESQTQQPAQTEALGQDPEKAARYIADAGYTEKNADGFYANASGAVCAFTLTCNAAKEAHVGYAELVKTQLEQFGIQVHLETLDADSYNAKTSNKFSENNITMEAAIYGFTASGMSMKNGLASIYVDGTHTPLLALYWDSQLLAHSAAYENFTVDAVFGLNNANTRFTITEK